MNDLRLKVVGWWRTGSTHIQRGDPEPGLRCCEEALALSRSRSTPPWSAPCDGYGLVKAGELASRNGRARRGRRVVRAVAAATTRARSSRSGWPRATSRGPASPAPARSSTDDPGHQREIGYRHLEGVAERLLAEVLGRRGPGGPRSIWIAAVRILEDVGARNELAKVLVAAGGLRRAAGDSPGRAPLLEQALAIFTALGTVDGPSDPASLLASARIAASVSAVRPSSTSTAAVTRESLEIGDGREAVRRLQRSRARRRAGALAAA